MSQFNLIGFSSSGANVFNNLTITENGAMVVPYGVSSERPVAPVAGMLRYDTTLSTIEYYNNIGWVQLIQYPAINSISPLSVADNSNGVYDISINIIGENFGATPNVYFIGSDSIERQSPAVTDIFSGTQVRATIPTSVYDNSGQEPFAVKVLNTSSGLSVTSVSPNVIDIDSVPYFITTSPLPDISNGSLSGSYTLNGELDISAGDAEGLALTWSSPAPSPISDIQSGALTLNSSTGAITGTLTNPGSTTNYNFNVKIEDTAGNFHIKLYSFTFTVPVAYTATTTGSNVTTIYVDSGNTIQGSATYGGYTIIVFGSTSGSGNTTTQSNSITPNFSSSDIKYLVLGGGGGTPGSNNSPSGGGGAGGYRTNYSGSLSPNISFVASTSYSISVGGGGSAGSSATNNASSGSASSLAYNGGTITSSGGGKGGFDNQAGSAGGSGGGGSLGGGGGSGNSGGYTPSEGNSGGSGNWGGGDQFAGGGGGAGGSGGSGSPSGSSGGAGGSGLSSTITGTSVTRGGGGAGASWGSNSRVGGSGGGGNQNSNGSNGYGGGAGGAGNTSQNNLAGKAGGNGIVIVRFPSYSGYS